MIEQFRNKLRKFMVNRYSNNPVPIEMQFYGEQFAYGHREILLQYCNIPERFMFKAHIPHGKISPTSIDPIHHINDENGNPVKQLLWREDSIEEAKAVGIANVFPIGATFLYALSNLGIEIEQISTNISRSVGQFNWPRDPESQNNFLAKFSKILYMPMHTWDGDVHVHKIPDQSPLLQLEDARVTVLLGFLDFCDPNIRRYYKDFGWNIECAGVRSSKITGSPAGGRNDFLYNLYALFNENEVVVSNEFTTGLFYAASTGKKIGILNQSTAHDLQYSSWQNQQQFDKRMSLIRSHYDWLNGVVEDIQDFSNTVKFALGVKLFKTPEELNSNIELIEFRSYGKNMIP